jgi:Flp pilus assembly pilin Flp
MAHSTLDPATDPTTLSPRRRLRRRRGQGMTEYIIIVGLIAICLVAAVKNFKTALGNAYSKSTQSINDDITTQIDAGGGSGS